MGRLALGATRAARTRRLVALCAVALGLAAAGAWAEGGSSVATAKEIVPGAWEQGNTDHAFYFRACNGTSEGKGDYWRISLAKTDVMTITMESKGGYLYAVDIFAPPTTAKTFTSETPTFFLTEHGARVTNHYTAAKTGVYYLVFDNYCGPDGPFQFIVHVSGPGTSSPSLPPTPAPILSQRVGAATVSGTATVKRPGTTAFVPLTRGVLIPLGSTVDASDGHVELRSATTTSATNTGVFYGGEFVVTQLPSGLTVLTLTGGPPCAATAAKTAPAPNRRNSLWGVAHAGFETNGHYAAATVLGTQWLTRDECTGTLIRVASGEVRVHDYVDGRTLKLRAPHHFVARP